MDRSKRPTMAVVVLVNARFGTDSALDAGSLHESNITSFVRPHKKINVLEMLTLMESEVAERESHAFPRHSRVLKTKHELHL